MELRQLWHNPALTPGVARALRNHALRHDRAHGMTIRALAHRYGVPRSTVHYAVRDTPINPPPHRYEARTVRTHEGGFRTEFVITNGPKPRGYQLRNGRRAT